MDTWLIIIAVIGFAVSLCFLLSIANHSGERFMERYEEMNKIQIRADISPLQFINFIQTKYFKTNLEVVQISQKAGDSYLKGKLYLSNDTLQKDSLASYTIISHEMGHALQDQEGNKLKKLRFLRKLGKILGAFMIPSLLAGLIVVFLDNLFWIGIGLFAFSILVFLLAIIIKIITISIEKDASKKAEVFLKEIMNENELKNCKKFLNDARLTYWGEFLRILLFWTGISKKGKLFN